MTQTFGPYTPVRQAGDLYFISGQVGVDPASNTAAADITGQTRQALINLDAVLKSVDLTLHQVVKTTIYVTDMSDFATVNDVYTSYFSQLRPARSTVAVAELPRLAGEVPLKVEIEAIAYLPASAMPPERTP